MNAKQTKRGSNLFSRLIKRRDKQRTTRKRDMASEKVSSINATKTEH